MHEQLAKKGLSQVQSGGRSRSVDQDGHVNICSAIMANLMWNWVENGQESHQGVDWKYFLCRYIRFFLDWVRILKQNGPKN